MKISAYLLGKFVSLKGVAIERVLKCLNDIGLEVDGVETYAIPKGVVVGRVVKKEAHPNADKLSVCEVDVGDFSAESVAESSADSKESSAVSNLDSGAKTKGAESKTSTEAKISKNSKDSKTDSKDSKKTNTLQIVCGAKNVEAGQFVAVATIGTILPHGKGGDLTIKKSDLRGVQSCGMLCSSSELGLPAINDGIMVLDSSVNNDKELVLGAPLSEVAFFAAPIIDIAITPNRGDCLSALGVARDIAAALNLPLSQPAEPTLTNTGLGIGKILHINTDEKLPCDLLYKIVDVAEVKTSLLAALSLGFNGVLKDDAIANFLEFGSFLSGVVLNAYPLSSLESKKESGKKDGNSSALAQKVLTLRKNENGFVSVVGEKELSVVGVELESSTDAQEVKDSKDFTESNSADSHKSKKFGTKPGVLVIEASFISPTLISNLLYAHKDTKKDAKTTYRTTRGSNPDLESGIFTLLSFMLPHAKMSAYQGTHAISRPKIEREPIKTSFERINAAIGTALPNEEIVHILQRLNFTLKVQHDTIYATPPEYRHDLNTTQDLNEEVLRIYGIDKVCARPLEIAERNSVDAEFIAFKNKRALIGRACALGYNECLHYVFGSRADQEKLGLVSVEKSLDLLNPITSELSTLRTSQIPEMLSAILRNANLGFKRIKLIEIGAVYDEARKESERVCVVAQGLKDLESYPHPKGTSYNIYAFLDEIAAIVGGFEVKNGADSGILAQFGFKDGGERLLHPFVRGSLFGDDAKTPLGYVAQIHPTIAGDLGEIFVAEFNLDFKKDAVPTAQPVLRFQKNSRDLTILVDKSVAFDSVREAVLGAKIANLTEIFALDLYADESLGDKHALSLRLSIQSGEKTLESAELDAISARVLEILAKQFGAVLR